MQTTATPAQVRAHARVISLEERRASRRARTKRARIPVRPLVALWFGTAIFATAALLGYAATVALREPTIGIPAGIAIASLASWHAAGSWLEQRRAVRAGVSSR